MVRETYLGGFIIVLKTGFQITGSSTVHGFRASGFLDLSYDSGQGLVWVFPKINHLIFYFWLSIVSFFQQFAHLFRVQVGDFRVNGKLLLQESNILPLVSGLSMVSGQYSWKYQDLEEVTVFRIYKSRFLSGCLKEIMGLKKVVGERTCYNLK